MFQSTREFAQLADKDDVLASYRNQFLIPKTASGEEVLYFTGNSLGLQPKERDNTLIRFCLIGQPMG